MKYKYMPTGTAPAPNQYPAYIAKGGAINAIVDLSNLFGPIEDQGALGSCSAFSGLQWFQAYLYKRYGIWIEFSELAQYRKEREIENTVDQDSGALMIDAVNVLVNTGVILEQEDDYLTLNFKDTAPDLWIPNLKLPKELVRTVTSLNDALDAIGRGYPVLIGFRAFKGLQSADVAKTGLLPMPDPSEQSDMGHGVVALGKNDQTRMVKCRNEWSPYWGDHGYFYMPYDYWQYVEEAYVIEFDGPIPAQPMPHRYGVEIEFAKTECAIGEGISVYIHTFDGKTPVNTINLGDGLFAQNNQIPRVSFVYPNGQSDSPTPLVTTDNGRGWIPGWGYAGPEEGLVIGRVEWLAPDGNTYTNEAFSVWRKPAQNGVRYPAIETDLCEHRKGIIYGGSTCIPPELWQRVGDAKQIDTNHFEVNGKTYPGAIQDGVVYISWPVMRDAGYSLQHVNGGWVFTK